MSSITSTPEKEALTLTVEDGIGWLTLDLPGEKVNKLSSAVMTSLAETLSELARRSDLEGVVIRSAKDGIFIAGADVREIRAITHREDAA
ncbi:MAG: enoyl-CoA hydratase/isomerase family protein, partial [Vicinamibacteria bacterium]